MRCEQCGCEVPELYTVNLDGKTLCPLCYIRKNMQRLDEALERLRSEKGLLAYTDILRWLEERGVFILQDAVVIRDPADHQLYKVFKKTSYGKYILHTIMRCSETDIRKCLEVLT